MIGFLRIWEGVRVLVTSFVAMALRCFGIDKFDLSVMISNPESHAFFTWKYCSLLHSKDVIVSYKGVRKLKLPREPVGRRLPFHV